MSDTERTPRRHLRVWALSTLALLFAALIAGSAGAVLCTYSYKPTSAAFGPEGGNGSLAVTVGPYSSCVPIQPTVKGSFFRITGSSGYFPNYTIRYAVDANTGCSSRTATVTQGTAVFRLTQTAVSASLSPTSASHAAGGGSGSFSVAVVGATCSWTAATSTSWITVNTPSGTGPGSVSYGVSANTGCASRTGTITAAGRTFTVTQWGVSTADIVLTPSSAAFASAGGAGSFSVTTGAGCGWTASTASSFLTLVYPWTGSGSGTVSYRVAANPSCPSRVGTITVTSGGYYPMAVAASKSFTVSQAGIAATGTLTPSSVSVSASSGSRVVSVAIGAGCAWTATSNASWLTVGPSLIAPQDGGGTGPGSTTVSWGENANKSPRSGTVTVANSPFTVTQAGSTKTSCVANDTTLCLLNNRFSVNARWTNYEGVEADGRAVPLTSDTGYFWFFHPDNVESVVKMVSFCGGGANAVAVYATGLTDVGVSLVVKDVWTGTTRTYRNVLGTPFRLIRDGPFACIATPPAVPSGGSDAAVPPRAGEDEAALAANFSYVAAEACVPDATTLCLAGGRFRVRARYLDYEGREGDGQARALTADTGYFWFFSSANVEIVAKLVSFCSQPVTRWGVYANGLTDTGVTLTVTDTRTGLTATYTNPLTRPFELIRDAAFACP